MQDGTKNHNASILPQAIYFPGDTYNKRNYKYEGIDGTQIERGEFLRQAIASNDPFQIGRAITMLENDKKRFINIKKHLNKPENRALLNKYPKDRSRVYA